MTTSARIVVADAGPLIALGRLDALHLLPKLFAEIQVTATVLDECLARPGLIDAQRKEGYDDSFSVEVIKTDNKRVQEIIVRPLAPQVEEEKE